MPFLLICSSAPAQYYLTGEVLDVHGDKLQNVSIASHSTGTVYLTDRIGEFRIYSRTMDDTLTFTVDGYEPYTTQVHTTGYLQVTLRMNAFSADDDGRRPVTVIRVPVWDTVSMGIRMGTGGGYGPGSGRAVGSVVNPASSVGGAVNAAARMGGVPVARSAGEGTASKPGVTAASGQAVSIRAENPFVPYWATVSFTGAVRREAYSTIRRFLDMGLEVPADAVKIEEMLNYFNFSYDPPGAKDLFTASSTVLPCPWNGGHRLLALRVCARKLDIGNRPPANLVLLVDASGSMDMPNKLPLVKAGVRLLVDNLRDYDTISVVEFGREVRVLFAGMPGSEKARILRAIEGLRADGPSPGLEGLRLAYDVAKQQFIPRGNNRVILLTDGDISLEPPAVEQDVEDLVGQGMQAGIRLTCGGLGMKSVKDSRLPLLAEIGRGDFAYLDDENMTEQLLAGELDPRLAAVANNVSLSVDFSPDLVSEYRLIGYNNKRNAITDSIGTPAGARVGSGSSQVALFEFAPKKDTTGADTLATVKVNYSLPGQSVMHSLRFDCMNDVVPFDRADPDWRRAICLTLFGMKLRHSGYTEAVSWPDIEKMAKRLFIGNNYLDDEYISLIDRAKRIYERE